MDRNLKKLLFATMCFFVLFVAAYDIQFTYEYREVMKYFEANPVQKWIMDKTGGVALSIYIRAVSIMLFVYVLYVTRKNEVLNWVFLSTIFVIHVFLFLKLYQCSEIFRGINAYVHIPMFFV